MNAEEATPDDARSGVEDNVRWHLMSAGVFLALAVVAGSVASLQLVFPELGARIAGAVIRAALVGSDRTSSSTDGSPSDSSQRSTSFLPRISGRSVKGEWLALVLLDRDRMWRRIGSRPDSGGIERRTSLPRSSRVQRGPAACRPGSLDSRRDPDDRPGRWAVWSPPSGICSDPRGGPSSSSPSRCFPVCPAPSGAMQIGFFRAGLAGFWFVAAGVGIPLLPRPEAHRAVLVRRVTVLGAGVLVPRLRLGRHRAGALYLRPDSGLAPERRCRILDRPLRAGRVDRSGSLDLDAWPCTVHRGSGHVRIRCRRNAAVRARPGSQPRPGTPQLRVRSSGSTEWTAAGDLLLFGGAFTFWLFAFGYHATGAGTGRRGLGGLASRTFVCRRRRRRRGDVDCRGGDRSLVGGRRQHGGVHRRRRGLVAHRLGARAVPRDPRRRRLSCLPLPSSSSSLWCLTASWRVSESEAERRRRSVRSSVGRRRCVDIVPDPARRNRRHVLRWLRFSRCSCRGSMRVFRTRRSSPNTARSYPEGSAAADGRAVYIREGCIACHTQSVRPIVPDVGLGPVSVAGDYVNEAPALVGVERLGPDLMHVGSRIDDADGLKAHLDDPRADRPWSIMPSYRYLTQGDLDALAEYLLSLR